MFIGYKAFDKNLINQHGKQFELHKIYSVDTTNNPIKFGNDGNGYHLCTNFEDTFRYVPRSYEIDLCLVAGFGDFDYGEDDFYGYYDMYAFEKIMLIKKFTREEIIEMALALNDISVLKFIVTFKLKEEEISLFKEKFKKYIRVMEFIAYHQEGDEKAFTRIRKLDDIIYKKP